MPPPADITIDRPDVPIVARDYGGPAEAGTLVLLLHGLGGTAEHWDDIAVRLADSHRPIAMDLRGHGLSGDAPWDWGAAIGDIEAVVAHFRLGDPVVVGHSLGGMLAMMWAARHPACPAIVNLDGFRSAETAPENYPGMDPAARDEALTALRSIFDAQAEALDHPIVAEQAAMLPQRSLIERAGETYMRPSGVLARQIRHSPEFRNAIDLLKDVRCRALAVLATQGMPGAGEQLMAAFRRGVRRDVLPIAEAMPNVEIAEVDASHNMVAEIPADLATMIRKFI